MIDPSGAWDNACADMAAGNNWRITDTKLMNIGYTFEEAAMIVAAATTAYCPALSPERQDAAVAADAGYLS